MSPYGDQATITAAQNESLRRIIAAVRCLAVPTGYLPDTAKARNHLDAAIAEIDRAEAAAKHTNDDAPAGRAEGGSG